MVLPFYSNSVLLSTSGTSVLALHKTIGTAFPACSSTLGGVGYYIPCMYVLSPFNVTTNH